MKPAIRPMISREMMKPGMSLLGVGVDEGRGTLPAGREPNRNLSGSSPRPGHDRERPLPGRRVSHGSSPTGAASPDQIRRVRRLVDGGPAHRRAHRRGHLHRQRHPRLPRPERRVDEEPEGRAHVRHRPLRRRSRGPAPGLAGRGSHHPVVAREPNPAHRALVELERRGRLHALVTQNIDGLHQRGRHRPRPASSRCTARSARSCACDCGERAPMARALDRVRAGEDDPPCRSCGGILKSATISFGQSLVAADLERADARPRRGRPAARRRHDPHRVSRRRRRAASPQRAGRPGRDRQRRADRVRRIGRRRAAGPITDILPVVLRSRPTVSRQE